MPAVRMSGQLAVRTVVVFVDTLGHIRDKARPARQFFQIFLLLLRQILAFFQSIKSTFHLAVHQVLRAAVHPRARKRLILPRHLNQIVFPPSLNDAASLRIARDTRFMADTQSGRNTRDFMVYRLAGLAAAVIRVIDNRQTKMLDPDTQSIRYRHTTFSKRDRKPDHKPRTTINNHRHLRLKRPAVYRMSHLRLKAVAVADPNIVRLQSPPITFHIRQQRFISRPRFPAALLHNQRELVPNAPYHTQARHIIDRHISRFRPLHKPAVAVCQFRLGRDTVKLHKHRQPTVALNRLNRLRRLRSQSNQPLRRVFRFQISRDPAV